MVTGRFVRVVCVRFAYDFFRAGGVDVLMEELIHTTQLTADCVCVCVCVCVCER